MSSLTKPLNGGNAEMETAPIRKRRAVFGIRLIKPPISSMFLVSVALTIEPDVRNSRLLKMAWFRQWKRAAEQCKKSHGFEARALRRLHISQADEDDADVFDAMISQHPFEVMLF